MVKPDEHRNDTTKAANEVAAAKPDEQSAFPIVGIGASAGGLEAFGQLLQCLPADTGMAFVLIQHLDPVHESQLAPLLSKNTIMPVTEVRDPQVVEPNHVYVIPPNTSMTIEHGQLQLTARDQAATPRRHAENLDSPRLDIDSEENEVINDAAFGPDFLREKVARPQRLGMHLNELQPTTLASLRTRIEAVPSQDVDDCRAGYFSNAEFAQLAEDARVTPSGLAGETDDQRLDVLSHPGSASPLLGRDAFGLPHPASESLRLDDGDQLSDGCPGKQTQPNQPSPFRPSGDDSFGSIDSAESRFPL